MAVNGVHAVHVYECMVLVVMIYCGNGAGVSFPELKVSCSDVRRKSIQL